MPANFSRFAKVTIRPEIATDRLLDVLEQEYLSGPTAELEVLYLTNDRMVTEIAFGWKRLEGKYLMSWAGCRDLVLALQNKASLDEICENLGFHHPHTLTISKRADVQKIAINGALMVDLTGQIGVYSIGPDIYTGLGGHLGFAIGASLAPKGRYVTVLPSTARGGTVSTIVPRFEAGQIVSVPRELADTVVTEQGIARLLGKSVRERADALIEIAHPDHRAELRAAARAYFYPGS